MKKQEREELTYPTKYLEFISHRIVSNVREMEGALNRLVAHAL